MTGRGAPERGPAAPDAEAIERRVRAMLEGLGVAYEWIPIDPAAADTAAFCARYGVPLDRAANTIVVVAKREPRRYAACVVLASTRLDVNHTVKRLLGGGRCSFASADETVALTGMAIGGVTVFALPPDLPLYVDARVTALDWVILGAGSRGAKVRTSPEVFRRLPNATIVPGLALAGERAADSA